MGTEYSGSELVDIARQIEAAGEGFYDAGLQHLKNPQIRQVFEFLRDEEARHAKTFEKLLTGLLEPDGDWRVDEEYLGYMRALADQRVFPTADSARTFVAKLENEIDAIKYALRFEKDTILFFHELREGVREESRSILDKLIAEERVHVRTLHRLLTVVEG